MNSLAENLSLGFLTRPDTNHAVQPQKMAFGFRFQIKGEEGLHYLCSENLRHYHLPCDHAADLCLCFHICNK